MFNILNVRTKAKEQDMGFLQRLKLGGLALEVAQWAGDLVRQIDVGTVLAIIGKVVELERNRRGIPGAEKLRELLGWLRESYPGVAGLQSVASFVSALVALFNGLQVFRK
jgi:hypothetical protein